MKTDGNVYNIHCVSAGWIPRLLQPPVLIQEFDDCSIAHTRIGGVAQGKHFPTCHTKGPLQQNHNHLNIAMH